MTKWCFASESDARAYALATYGEAIDVGFADDAPGTLTVDRFDAATRTWSTVDVLRYLVTEGN